MPSRLFTCEEVAERYRVSKCTVWDWIRKGKLDAIKMPKGYRVSDEAIAKYDATLKSSRGGRSQ